MNGESYDVDRLELMWRMAKETKDKAMQREHADISIREIDGHLTAVNTKTEEMRCREDLCFRCTRPQNHGCWMSDVLCGVIDGGNVALMVTRCPMWSPQ